MVYIDYSDEKGIDQLVSQWANRIKALGAQDIAGVTKEHYAKGKWAVDLVIYADPDSDEYKDFMRRFGR